MNLASIFPNHPEKERIFTFPNPSFTFISMQLILSPAKTMTGKSSIHAPSGSEPRFGKEACEIALEMAQCGPDELARLLKLNPKLAGESYRRFQDFHSDSPPLQALLAYTGVVYKNIRPADFTESDFRFAQEHLRIASICYGLLRPLDLIKPYRMEYDVSLPELEEGNMYDFWRPRQTDFLIGDIQADDGILINLASQEIQPAFEWKRLSGTVRIVTPEFKIWKNGKPRTIVIYTKMARGQMTRHILKNRLSDPDALKAFSWEGFRYNEDLSEGDRWVFLQG